MADDFVPPVVTKTVTYQVEDGVLFEYATVLTKSKVPAAKLAAMQQRKVALEAELASMTAAVAAIEVK